MGWIRRTGFFPLRKTVPRSLCSLSGRMYVNATAVGCLCKNWIAASKLGALLLKMSSPAQTARAC
jgi:hypothetical protein